MAAVEFDYGPIGGSSGGGGGGLAAVVDDTSPQLGGNLDPNGNTVGDATAADLTKLHALTATSTELNHVDGVTSAIQTQINAKAPTDNPTFTGTVGGVTKGMVGLGNADNTTDAGKPVSTATQTALDLKLNIADGITISGVASKTTPVDADDAVILDSAASDAPKLLSWANIKATLKAYFDPFYIRSAISDKSAAYTTVLSDEGTTIRHPAADNNARTFTIDSNANVAYPVGTVISFINEINTVTISITADTMVLAGAGTTGSRTLAANGWATAQKVASTRWYVSGNGLT